jgi:hypothetical protein
VLKLPQTQIPAPPLWLQSYCKRSPQPLATENSTPDVINRLWHQMTWSRLSDDHTSTSEESHRITSPPDAPSLHLYWCVKCELISHEKKNTPKFSVKIFITNFFTIFFYTKLYDTIKSIFKYAKTILNPNKIDVF